MHISRKRFLSTVGLLLLMAASWKLIFLIGNKFPFNSDEAIVGLMARHILSGSKPIYFYGQAYMGSLDAWFISFGFLIFGQHVWVIRFVQTLLYIGVIGTTIWISCLITRNKTSGLITGLLLALPTVNMTLYTTVSLGGYNEALLIGNILIILGIKLRSVIERNDLQSRAIWLFFFWGVAAGLGLWVNSLTLIYSIPSFFYLLWMIYKRSKPGIHKVVFLECTLILVGFLLGSILFWIYGFQNGWESIFGELIGSAVSVETGTFLHRALLHLRNLVLFGIPVLLGIRPPWAIKWLVLPLLPFNIMAWFSLIWFSLKSRRDDNHSGTEIILLLTISLLLLLGFIFTSFGLDPSGRYFLPLYFIMALLAGISLPKADKRLIMICVSIILFFNLGSTLQCAMDNDTGLTTQFYAPSIIDHSYDQQLMEFLQSKGENYGYTNYWVAYPLAFLSSEQILFIPELPYHTDLSYTERDNRYEPYLNIVDQVQKPAYITTGQLELEEYIRESLHSLKVNWKEKVIGDYRVFYNLSDTVRPSDMGLGISR